MQSYVMNHLYVRFKPAQPYLKRIRKILRMIRIRGPHFQWWQETSFLMNVFKQATLVCVRFAGMRPRRRVIAVINNCIRSIAENERYLFVVPNALRETRFCTIDLFR
jgi:hypothetical protein